MSIIGLVNTATGKVVPDANALYNGSVIDLDTVELRDLGKKIELKGDETISFWLQSNNVNNSVEFEDLSTVPCAISALGGVKHSTADKYFTSLNSSVVFDGVDDALRIDNIDGAFNIGLEDFTLDVIFKINDYQGDYPEIFQLGWKKENGNSYYGIEIYADESSGVSFYIYKENESIEISSGLANVPPIGVWTNIRVCRKDGIFYLYQNGILVGQDSTVCSLIPEGITALILGGYFNFDEDNLVSSLNGSIQEIKFINGVALSDGTNYTIPTPAEHSVVTKEIGMSIKDVSGSYRSPSKYDDITKGFSHGSRWVNALKNKIFFCKSNTEGNAVWKEFISSPSNREIVHVDGGYTITADDVDKYLIFDTSGNCNLQLEADVYFPIGGEVEIFCLAPTGNTEVNPAGGITFNCIAMSIELYEVMTLKKVGPDVWHGRKSY